MSSTNGAATGRPAVPAFNMSLKAKGTKAKPARKAAAAVHAHADDDDEDGDGHNARREFVTSVAAGEVHGTAAKEEKQVKVIPLSVNPWEQAQQAAAAAPAVADSAENAVAAKTLDELAAEALSREAAEEQARSQGRRSGDVTGNNMGMDSTRVIKLQVCLITTINTRLRLCFSELLKSFMCMILSDETYSVPSVLITCAAVSGSRSC
jgi:hypothetical protein